MFSLTGSSSVLALAIAIQVTSCAGHSNTSSQAESLHGKAISQEIGQPETTPEFARQKWQDLKAYSYDQREEFAQEVREAGRSIRDTWEKAKAETNQSADEVSEKAKNAWNEIQKDLDQLSDTAAENWESLKARTVGNLDEMQTH